MSAQAPALSPSWSSDLETMIRQVRDETITFASIGLGLLALALLGYVITHQGNPDRIITVILLSFIVPGAVWLLRERFYAASAWGLVAGMLLIDLLVVSWLDLPAVMVLLVLPVGLATLMISRPAGLAVAALCTAIALLAQSLPVPVEWRLTTVISAWSVVGMIWLTLRPLLTAVQWAWSGYEQSKAFLDQAQEYLVQLQEALKDLADANVQLTRLNLPAAL